MSKPSQVIITETKQTLKQQLKQASLLIAPRIRMLLVELEYKATGISRRDLAL